MGKKIHTSRVEKLGLTEEKGKDEKISHKIVFTNVWMYKELGDLEEKTNPIPWGEGYSRSIVE